jgi:uncharacterized integral membrane protein
LSWSPGTPEHRLELGGRHRRRRSEQAALVLDGEGRAVAREERGLRRVHAGSVSRVSPSLSKRTAAKVMSAIVAHNEHARALRPSSATVRSKTIAALAVGVLLIAFGLSNRNDVPIDWLVGTTDTPLIVVIVVSAALGAILGRRRGQGPLEASGLT